MRSSQFVRSLFYLLQLLVSIKASLCQEEGTSNGFNPFPDGPTMSMLKKFGSGCATGLSGCSPFLEGIQSMPASYCMQLKQFFNCFEEVKDCKLVSLIPSARDFYHEFTKLEGSECDLNGQTAARFSLTLLTGVLTASVLVKNFLI